MNPLFSLDTGAVSADNKKISSEMRIAAEAQKIFRFIMPASAENAPDCSYSDQNDHMSG